MFRTATLRAALFTLLAGITLLSAPVLAADTKEGACKPVRSTAVLEMRALVPGTVVQLLDAQGQVIGTVEAATTTTRLPLAGLPAGTYTVRVGADRLQQFAIRFDGRRVTGTVTANQLTAATQLAQAGQ